jgi:hypothetical protein
MSRKQFDDDCPGCRPVVIDVKTGKPDDRAMAAINQVWEHTTVAERKAFHEFTCLNSRDPEVMAVISRLSERFTQAMESQSN